MAVELVKASATNPPAGLLDFLREGAAPEPGSSGTRYRQGVSVDAYLRELERISDGIDLTNDLVPETSFWLIDNGRIVALTRLRHTLNDYLTNYGGHIGYYVLPSDRRKGYGTLALFLTLQAARDLAITEVLITCDTANEASRKIIEANGGILEDERVNDETGVTFRRYWIDLV